MKFNKLETLKKMAEKDDLRGYVANEMLETIDNDGYSGNETQQLQSWYNDLMQGGCKSGFISGLIYYADTTEFYRIYADDIWELLGQEAKNLGLTVFEMLPELDENMQSGEQYFQNYLAWFGFEETARKIAGEIGLEV